MRKTNFSVFCVASFLFFSLLMGSNQDARAGSGLGFGLKAGFSSTNLTEKHFAEVGSPRSGYNIGAFVNYDILEYLGVTLEVQYGMAGAANLDPNYFYSAENKVLSSPIVNSSLLVNQISTPLLVSFNLPGVQGAVKPRIYAGADFSYFLTAKSLNTYAEPSTTGVDYYRKELEKLGNRMEKFDLGLIGGTGLSIEGGKNLTYWFDARYRMGLTNINAAQSNFIDHKLKKNFMTFQFGVSYNL